MTDLIKFGIPSEYVAQRVALTPDEVVYGVRHEWLGAQDAARYAMRVLGEAGVSADLEPLALLDGQAVLGELLDEIDRLEKRAPCTDNSKLVWLFLALSWLREHESDFDDSMHAIEMLYADFGYPTEMESFVPFLPAPPGETSSRPALEARWDLYLAAKAKQYRAR